MAAQPPRRARPAPAQRRGTGGVIGRVLAVGALVAVCGVVLAIILGSGKGGGGNPSATRLSSATQSSSSVTRPSSRAAPKPAAVPILAYNVINTQPPGSTLSSTLYVPVDQFTAQMQALKSAGWHAITLDQLKSYWGGKSLGVRKPFVITFDGGYASQYANALPVLKQLGWVGVLDVPQTLLATSEGGLADSQVRALASAGWEIDAMSPTFTTPDATTAQQTLTSERQAMASQYGASVNWLAYSLGKYNATMAQAARAAGFSGALTGAAGWADPARNRFTLARVVVAGGTSAQQLLSQIAADQRAPAPPDSSS